jgi:hypothetical protein
LYHNDAVDRLMGAGNSERRDALAPLLISEPIY